MADANLEFCFNIQLFSTNWNVFINNYLMAWRLRKCSFLKCKRYIKQSKECDIYIKLTLEPLEYTTDLYLTEDKTKLKYNLYTIKAFICLCP